MISAPAFPFISSMKHSFSLLTLTRVTLNISLRTGSSFADVDICPAFQISTLHTGAKSSTQALQQEVTFTHESFSVCPAYKGLDSKTDSFWSELGSVPGSPVLTFYSCVVSSCTWQLSSNDPETTHCTKSLLDIQFWRGCFITAGVYCTSSVDVHTTSVFGVFIIQTWSLWTPFKCQT